MLRSGRLVWDLVPKAGSPMERRVRAVTLRSQASYRDLKWTAGSLVVVA
jgi:hypothetical protein